MKFPVLLLPAASSLGLLFTVGCGSLGEPDPSWEDVSSDYKIGSLARVSGGLGTAFYNVPGSSGLPAGVLRHAEEVTILEVSENWSRVSIEGRGSEGPRTGWVSTRELIPLSGQ